MPPESEDGAAAVAAALAVPLVPAQVNVTVVEELVCDDASTASCMQRVVPAVSQLLRQLGDAISAPQPAGEPRKLPPLDFQWGWFEPVLQTSLGTRGSQSQFGDVRLVRSIWQRSLVQPVADGRLRRSAGHNGRSEEVCRVFPTGNFVGRPCGSHRFPLFGACRGRVGTGRRQASIQCLARSAHWTCLCVSVVVRNAQSPCRSAGQ